MSQEIQISAKKKKLLIALMRLNEFSLEEILDLLDIPASRQSAYRWLSKDKKENNE